MGAGGSKKHTITMGAREMNIERVLGKGAFGKVHCLIVSLFRTFFSNQSDLLFQTGATLWESVRHEGSQNSYFPKTLHIAPHTHIFIQILFSGRSTQVMNKQQILEKGAHCARNTVRERLMLSKLNNPFIVNLWGALQDDQNLYLVSTVSSLFRQPLFVSSNVVFSSLLPFLPFPSLSLPLSPLSLHRSWT
jgi:hypothetical protein